MTVTRPVKRRRVARAFCGEHATMVLRDAGFGEGMEVAGFTKGQFSFVDLIEAVLVFTGPADFLLSTWAASVTDLGRLGLFCDDGRIRSARFLLDGAFESYNKQAAADLRERFGDANIRIVPNHAKFALIGNEAWHVVVQTSMNLNQNRRIESFNLSEGAEFHAAFEALATEIWDLQKPAAAFGAAGYRAASATLGALGAGRSSGFYDVTAGVRLLER